MNAYQNIYDAQKAFFKSGATRQLAFRKQQLKKLDVVLRAN